jgi:hypothetical protein
MQQGEFTQLILRNGTPKPDILNDYGSDTRSLAIAYLDEHGQTVAEVHQYVSPDGKILYLDKDTNEVRRDGLPDPKVLVENSVLYRLESPKKKKATTE